MKFLVSAGCRRPYWLQPVTGWSQGESARNKSTPQQGSERLNRAPVVQGNPASKAARPRQATLSNGIMMMILEDHRFPAGHSAIRPSTAAGPLYEPANQPGLAGATRGCWKKARKTRTSKQIAEQMTLWARHFPPQRVWFRFGPLCSRRDCRHFRTMVRAGMDVLLRPSFPADELDQYQGACEACVMQQRSQPNFWRTQTLSRALYGEYPAAVVSATPESLDR